MARISFAGFKDPKRRPRYIVWAVVAVLVIVAVMIPVLGVTSTRWFCAEGCHKVQDDTITAYEHSPHSEISCMACHMPVNANPVVFLLHKAEALGELYLTVTNKFELPLNAESEVALTMKSTQCTQCHDDDKRTVTPSPGIKIDHAVHAENGVDCTICHNRTAHVEDFELDARRSRHREAQPHARGLHGDDGVLPLPLAGLPGKDKPTGACAACHTPGFELKPPEPPRCPASSPRATASSAPPRRAARSSRAELLVAERVGPRPPTEGESARRARRRARAHETLGESLPTVESINECSTCHKKKFCIDCHGGVPMPHPADFKEKHGKLGKEAPKSCAKCHGAGGEGCNSCHHGTEMDYPYNPNVAVAQAAPGGGQPSRRGQAASRTATTRPTARTAT